MADELMACPLPWCGGHARVKKSPISTLARVTCEDCHLLSPMFDTEAEASAAWNCRDTRIASTRPADSALGDELAREALFGIELARTEVVNPVNGSRPYSYVTFADARIEFQQFDREIKYHNGSPIYDAATDKAAAQAQSINDILFDVAKRAISLRQPSPPPDSALMDDLSKLAIYADHADLDRADRDVIAAIYSRMSEALRQPAPRADDALLQCGFRWRVAYNGGGFTTWVLAETLPEFVEDATVEIEPMFARAALASEKPTGPVCTLCGLTLAKGD